MAKQHEGSSFPGQGLNPCPQQWKRRVLRPLDHQASPQNSSLKVKERSLVFGMPWQKTLCVWQHLPCPYLGLHWLLATLQMLVPLLFTLLPTLPHLFSEHMTHIAMLPWLWSLCDIWNLQVNLSKSMLKSSCQPAHPTWSSSWLVPPPTCSKRKPSFPLLQLPYPGLKSC